MRATDQLSVSDFVDREEYDSIITLAHRASTFVSSHKWCSKVVQVYFDRGFSKAAVFFVKLVPSHGADPEVWVICGDVPPAYIDTFYCKNGAQALAAYVRIMREWVDAVNNGEGVEGLMPVLTNGSFQPVVPTAELANQLSGRLDFLEEDWLSKWKDELNE